MLLTRKMPVLRRTAYSLQPRVFSLKRFDTPVVCAV
jgi:hypothetical protein